MSVSPFGSMPVGSQTDFVSKVYTMLGLSLLSSACGSYLGLSMPLSWYWPVVILWFVVLLACMLLQRRYPINVLLLFAFTFLGGLSLGPTLNFYVAHGAGGLISLTATLTALLFGSLSAYVHVSKRDFSFLGGFLFIALLGMILIGLASMFFHLTFNMMVYSGFGILLFSGYVLFDTSNILRRYESDQYVAATIALFLDILLLFQYILVFLTGRDSRR